MRIRTIKFVSESGSGLLGVAIGVALTAIGLISLAGVQIAASQLREQSLKRELVLVGLETSLDRVKGTAPNLIASTFNGLLINVAGVQGTFLGGAAISMSVDSTNPKLLTLTADASWYVKGITETFSVITEVYNP